MPFCRLGALGADYRVSRAMEWMQRERRDETEISARVVCYFLTHKLHANTPHFYIVKLECTLSNLFSSGAWIVGDRRSCLLEAVLACTHNLCFFAKIREIFQQTNLQQKIVISSTLRNVASHKRVSVMALMSTLLTFIYICKSKQQCTDHSAHPCSLLHAYAVIYQNTV